MSQGAGPQDYDFTDTSLVRPLATRVYFTRMFRLVPRWLAANLITLLGFGATGAMFVLAVASQRVEPTVNVLMVAGLVVVGGTTRLAFFEAFSLHLAGWGALLLILSAFLVWRALPHDPISDPLGPPAGDPPGCDTPQPPGPSVRRPTPAPPGRSP